MAASESGRSGAIANPRTARIAVAAIFCVNGALMATWFARIPDVKQQLGLSEGALSLALLCAAVGALIAQPTTGWAIGRLGSRILTSVLAILFCAVVILPSVSPALPILMLSLFVLGAINGGLDVSMNAQAALVERRYGRSIMNSFHALWSVGGLAGAALGGLAAGRGLPVAVHFAIGAGVGVFFMFVATRGLVADGPATGGDGPAFALPTRALLPMGIVALSALICEGAIGDWGAIYLREGLGSSAGVAAIGYAIFALMMAGGRFAGDWLATRFGSAQIVRAGGMLVVAGIILALILVDAPGIAIIGYGLIGAGVSCVFPLILSSAARTPGVAPGVGIAAMATAGYTGFLLGPPLIGGLAEVVTLRGSLGVLAIFGVLIVLLGSKVDGQGLTQAGSAAD
ncbi:MAG: MFS transporter [Chloroflexota bacterium]|nr:MFS transporter [Chloroflexota bacterium]